MLTKPVAVPKPKADPRRRTRTHRKRIEAFKDAVWAREVDENGWANCFHCGRIVKRGSEFFDADVHHVLHRSTHPELRYEPLNGQLSCIECHRKGEKL